MAGHAFTANHAMFQPPRFQTSFFLSLPFLTFSTKFSRRFQLCQFDRSKFHSRVTGMACVRVIGHLERLDNRQ